ncbi:transcription factor RF2a-like [Lolium rigidum]|uniref:transcription factor RF2a-like n=1 Tax=Lolium rigidum TaxID=89674 RepID=UPI001F5D8455|nr:transcription factor RF2a-like [Lolium rigidum]
MATLPAPVSASTSAAGSDVAPPTLEDSPPRRTSRHRRAQSEILLGATALPDDLAFDAADLGVVAAATDDDDEEDEYEDYEEGPGGGNAGSRMFQMFLEAGGRLGEPTMDSAAPYPPPPPARPRHQHIMSMDGSTSFASASSAAAPGGRAAADAKKAISDAKLALVDPRRAKR